MSSAPSVPGSDGLRILNAGESAVLAECVDPARILPLYTRMRDAALPGVVDLVPAEVTLLISFDPAVVTRARTIEAVQKAFAAVDRVRHAAPVHPRDVSALVHPAHASAFREGAVAQELDVDIEVRYDGPDIDDVVRMLRLADVDELIALHTGQLWTAAFIGFAPGFAYLRGETDRLDLPRRPTPRPTVPPGSVALAAGYCGIYPRASPGGWHLIGTTDIAMWDAAREPASLVEPGSRVRFHRAG